MKPDATGARPRPTTHTFGRGLRVRRGAVAALGAVAAPLIYFLPALLAGIVLCPDDGLLFNVPLRVAAARIASGGDLPLWNPYIFGGMPLLAAAQGGLLFPLNWFYVFFDAPAATNLSVISTYVLAGLGAYLYARRSGASLTGSLVTSLAWQWGGFLVAQLAHINIAQTAAMLPWVLWALDGYVGGGGRRRGVLLAALVALQAFVGHQQTFAYALALVLAYATVSALGSGRRALSRYLRTLSLVAAGVLLASVQIVPTYELLRHSPRAETTYEFFTSFSMPRRFVLTFVAPYVQGGGDGRLFDAPYVGPPFYAEYVAYVGLLTIMLAVAAVLLGGDARTKFWAVTAFVCLLLALGGYAPFGVDRLLYQVPVLAHFRVPARHLMEVEFALAVLAGRGVTALEASGGGKKARRLAAAAGVCVLLLTCLAVTSGRPAEFVLGGETLQSFLRTPELFAPLMLACASAWTLRVFARGRGRFAAALLITVLAADLSLWGQSSGWWVASPRTDSELWRTPETVEFLRARRGATPERILTVPHAFDPSKPPVPPSVSHAKEWGLWTQPDVYMSHGVENAAGYDGFGLARYNRLAGDMKVWGELTDPDRTLRGGGREIDLLNVRYLFAMRERGGQSVGVQTRAWEFAAAAENYGGSMFAAGDLGLPNVGAGRRLRFAHAPTEADRVALLTNLSWAAGVPDGVTVGRVRLRADDGRVFELALRAGADTAEWAYDRADVRARVRHGRAPVATSYAVDDPRGRYDGHTYVATLRLPERARITGGEISAEPSSGWPDLLLGVYRVTLSDEREGKSYPLRRDWISAEGAEGSGGAAGGASEDTTRWRLITTVEKAQVDIYENSTALPRAWLASETRVLGEQATLETIRTGRLPDGARWEPLRTALIEAEVSGVTASSGPPGAAEITLRKPNRVELKTVSDAPSILVLSENHYPGWRAYLDGHSVGVLRVNYGLRGVIVPAGEHEVSFVYRPKSVLAGLLITLLTAAALSLWWAGLLPEARGRRAAHAPHSSQSARAERERRPVGGAGTGETYSVRE